MKSKKVKLLRRVILEINQMQNHKFYALLVFLMFCVVIFQLEKIADFINAIS